MEHTNRSATAEGPLDAPAPPAAPPRRPGVLDGLSRRRLARLARRADRLRRRDVDRFGQLADQHGVAPRQLRLLADAWAEGGASGIQAIGPAAAADPVVLDRATAVVETWRRRHFPLDSLRCEVWRNRVTVWWMLPAADRTAGLEPHALMQLRVTPDGRWHLYRRAVQGEWWPVRVRGRRRRQCLSACLDAVRVDPLHQFWGVDGPPRDLASGDGLPDVPSS